MLKLIFLDIDGVLNSEASFERNRENHTWSQIDAEMVARLNKLLVETGASVVLSSTWRLDSDWRSTLARNGVNVDCFIGATPRMPRPVGTSHEYCERGKEIAQWLSEHDTKGVQYAILDDDSDFLPEQPHFRTSWKIGLTDEICEAVKRHLSTPSL